MKITQNHWMLHGYVNHVMDWNMHNGTNSLKEVLYDYKTTLCLVYRVSSVSLPKVSTFYRSHANRNDTT